MVKGQGFGDSRLQAGNPGCELETQILYTKSLEPLTPQIPGPLVINIFPTSCGHDNPVLRLFQRIYTKSAPAVAYLPGKFIA